ncbi:uncharacterized protein [Fopius arisanus]|uniref:UBC33 protein n=1 Tax=Fopius arisanus TaxID=64838 RepID=A0A0C9Q3M2_9HYME|nr:PREDICTED: uncharacterized protein LOC105267182 isoform X2 [Fopius arisanus]
MPADVPQYNGVSSSSSVSMARESVWKRTKAYFRRMRGKKVGGWIALLLLLICGQEIEAHSPTDWPIRDTSSINIIECPYDHKIGDNVMTSGPALKGEAWEMNGFSDFNLRSGSLEFGKGDIWVQPSDRDDDRLVMEFPPKWIDTTDFAPIICTTSRATLG